MEDKGPWSFIISLLARRRYELDLALWKSPFDFMPVWVQLKGLPFEWVSELVLKKLGSKIGRVTIVEPGSKIVLS